MVVAKIDAAGFMEQVGIEDHRAFGAMGHGDRLGFFAGQEIADRRPVAIMFVEILIRRLSYLKPQ